MDHSMTGLAAARKALTDAVAPAVDPADPLAVQQLGLVVDFLDFLAARLPHLHTRARLELVEAHRLGRAAARDVAEVDRELSAALADAVVDAALALSDAATPTGGLESATAGVHAALRDAVRASAQAAAGPRRRLARLVLDDSAAAAARHRAWYLPLGFDPYPSEVEPLAEVLDRERRAADRSPAPTPG
ncbi:hypothetical protein ACQP04_25280 [Pseudonocardia halophobica]|uniref:hypothetical protein n=1 Tax=Pseudonocardia halophobica TaxID=29401 RepID=UPI003D8AA0BF